MKEVNQIKKDVMTNFVGLYPKRSPSRNSQECARLKPKPQPRWSSEIDASQLEPHKLRHYPKRKDN